ncbi:oxidoreductase, aldo/keto reductase [Enterococcus canis]|uniref:Oxidoreductase, aldo/keto reductase n=1 Tax=Enterococcus canis TaxID=214095 RepID=A0A1L8RK77_9ENTE|nr:aldo/keto reductase [Enterococcus canis]OJG20180.1 oxidoreductase, aldo/keto reductase [Enterococcus canis]
MTLTDTYTLANGVKIPVVGLGTWQTPDGSEAEESVRAALKNGYRHIDTAAAYGNEASVGRAIKESGIPREEIFVTSKLWNTMHGYENTLEAFDETLTNLGMDYLDLYLIHWPNPIKFRDNWEEANAGSWKAMEELYEAGKIKAIGISNFREHHIDALLKTAKITPMVNQIRLTPGDPQTALVNYCRDHGMLLEAYSPLGTGKIFEVPEMKELAEKHHKTVAQIALRWSLQMGFLPLPKSVHENRIQENADIFDFELSGEDMALIAELKDVAGTASDPDTATF